MSDSVPSRGVAGQFPWQRSWFFVASRERGKRMVRADQLPVVLGPLLPELLSAWVEWERTGVEPECPAGVDQEFMRRIPDRREGLIRAVK